MNLNTESMVDEETRKARLTNRMFPWSHGQSEGLGFSQEGSREPGINSKQAYDLMRSEPLLFRKTILATVMGEWISQG